MKPNIKNSVCVVVVALGCASMLPGVSAPFAAEPQQRVERLAIDEHSNAAGELATTNEDRIAATPEATFAAQVFRQANISRDVIAAGNIKAISRDRSVTVTAANVDAVVVPGTVLLNRVDTEARVATAPRELMADRPNAKTYALSWEIVTPEGRFRAWGRDSTGLNFDGSNGEFAGEFDVALVRTQSPEDRSALSDAVSVAVSAPGASMIDPRPVEIRQLRDWHPVAVTVPVPGDSAYEIGVSADPEDDGDRIQLAITRPAITISTTPESVVGWGIGKSKVAIHARGMRNPEGYQVAMSSSNGTFESSHIALNDQGKGAMWLWSSGQDSATVSVADSAFDAVAKDIDFESPWLYVVLAVAGGLVAAVLKGRGRDRWIRALSIGALSGLLMALMYSVGIPWLDRAIPGVNLAQGGEAVVFVLGAVGAYLGVGAALGKPDREQPG